MEGGAIRRTALTVCLIPVCQAVLAGGDVGKAAADSVGNVTRSEALNEVVITATRIPKTFKNVPVLTRVITAKEIARGDATDIRELLTHEMPGLEFGYAMSQETTLSMNGFGGNAVLFLVDGERPAGETMDNPDYSRLNLSGVGRVEIVKGAASAVYGANAVGGVVNLISKAPTEPWRLDLDSRYDAFGAGWRNGIKLGLNRGRVTSSTTVQLRTAGTVRLTDAFDTESKIHAVYGGRTLNARERLTFRAGRGMRLTAKGGYFERTSERDNYADLYNGYDGGIRAAFPAGDAGRLELAYNFDRYDKSRSVAGKLTHDHDYSNRQNTVHLLYSVTARHAAIIVGADGTHDYLKSYQFADGKRHRQLTADAFAELEWSPLPRLNVVAGVRNDYFSASRLNALTARCAALLKLSPVSVRASYAGGFRAPTLKEMHMCFDMAGIQMIYGNPDLKPERSHNFILSLERGGRTGGIMPSGAYSVNLSCSYSYYDSRITTTDYPEKTTDIPAVVYTNERGIRVAGIDLNARYTAACGAGAAISYNYLRVAGNTVESQFTQPRPHSATWRLDYDRRITPAYNVYAALTGRYLSRPDSRLPTDGAYSIWRFTARLRFRSGISLNVTMDNIFNYRPKVYYWNSAPVTGVSWSVGVSININMCSKLFNELFQT